MKTKSVFSIAIIALFSAQINAQIGPENTCIGPVCNDQSLCTPTTLRDSVVQTSNYDQAASYRDCGAVNDLSKQNQKNIDIDKEVNRAKYQNIEVCAKCIGPNICKKHNEYVELSPTKVNQVCAGNFVNAVAIAKPYQFRRCFDQDNNARQNQGFSNSNNGYLGNNRENAYNLNRGSQFQNCGRQNGFAQQAYPSYSGYGYPY